MEDTAESERAGGGDEVAGGQSFPPLPGFLAITGPTASGKSGIALEIAPLIGAEIVSLDSMAIYRGMDIGTAKASAEERARVPHHLLDLAAPSEEFSLAQYTAAAHQVAGEIRRRGKRPLFVGGTPLYLKALLRGLFSGPPPDWDFRRQMQAASAASGSESLHAQLQQVDPASAARLHPRDERRIIRALEVNAKLGRPLSELQAPYAHPRTTSDHLVLQIDWPLEELNERIDARVDAMFAAGLVEEVQRLVDGGLLSRTAGQAVGYQEVADFLAGRSSLQEAVALVKMHTRQFAKRQRTWFRSLTECQAVPAVRSLDPAKMARELTPRFAELP